MLYFNTNVGATLICSPAGIGQVPRQKIWISCLGRVKSSASISPVRTGLFAHRPPSTNTLKPLEESSG